MKTVLRSLAVISSLIMILGSCGVSASGSFAGRAYSVSPADKTALKTELGEMVVHVIVAPGSPDDGPGENDARMAAFETQMRRIAALFELRVDIRRIPGKIKLEDHASSDIVFYPFDDSPDMRKIARLIPFLPSRGSNPSGHALSWIAVRRDRRILARLVADYLAATRLSGALIKELDAVLGSGTIADWYKEIGSDGVVYAEYLDLSEENLDVLDTWRQQGRPLRMARLGIGTAQVSDGLASTVDLNLASSLASSLGLTLHEDRLNSLDAFYARKTRILQDSGAGISSPAPDLLKTVDFYCGAFSEQPWKSDLMNIIRVMPLKNHVAVLAENGNAFKLGGKRIAVISGSPLRAVIREITRKDKATVQFLEAANGTDLFAMLRKKTADCLVESSLFFFRNRELMEGMTILPFQDELAYAGWCVKKDDILMTTILNRFMDASKNSGFFNLLWKRAYQENFSAYLELSGEVEPVKQ